MLEILDLLQFAIAIRPIQSPTLKTIHPKAILIHPKKGGDILRAARMLAGLTQGQTAYMCRMGQVSVSRFETGKIDYSFDQLIRILRVIGLEIVLKDVGNSPAQKDKEGAIAQK